ncbi:MAG TPA: hypothetical protein ENJ97_03935 [Planctomycetes bacterium]|nr:hypothetical protein [Planctomycetota bacterium]
MSKGMDLIFFKALGARTVWIAASRFGISLPRFRSPGRLALGKNFLWLLSFQPGFLYVLEFPEGKEGLAERARKELESFLLEVGSLAAGKGGENGPGRTRFRSFPFHGRTFEVCTQASRWSDLDLLFLGTFGRFLVVSPLTPWPLLEAARVVSGKGISLAGQDRAEVFRKTSPDRVVFVLDPGLLPWRLVPEPLPLAWGELGLPEVRWIQGEWDPATGKTSYLARTEKAPGGVLGDLAKGFDPDDLARLLPADTAAFGVVPFHWRGCTARLKELLGAVSSRGMLLGRIPTKELVQGFSGESLLVSPLPMLGGTRALGFALRFNKALPFPDFLMALRLAKGFRKRAQSMVEEQVRKKRGVRARDWKGLRIYQGPWLWRSTFVFKGDWVLVVPKRGMIRAFLPALAGEAPSLADQDTYKAFRGALPKDPCLGFFYVDGPRALGVGESVLRFFLPALSARAGLPDLTGLLHSENELESVLSSYGGGIFLEEKGISLRSDFPFSPLNLLGLGNALGLDMMKDLFGKLGEGR